MNQTQRQVHDQISRLLAEHFTTCLVIVSYDDPEAKNGQDGITCGFWHGGLHNALGLARAAIDDMLEERRRLLRENPVKDDEQP